MTGLQFPEGKNFAFTIFDDTDGATADNIKPIYELLIALNIITTKSVWLLPTKNIRQPHYHSQTLANNEYLEFIKTLISNGYEIALHSISMDSSTRESTLSGIELFKEILGFYPKIHTNHESNKENLYWGTDRVDFPLYKFIMSLKGQPSDSEGHKPDSPYFWGDICQKHIEYVRNFTFKEINLRLINPTLPYKDPNRPFINYWFSSSDGGSVKKFNQLISSDNQNRLESEGGICIVYTHFADGFVDKGKVNSIARKLLIELSKRNGWFVPVSTLLDYLRSQQTDNTLSFNERFKMESRWIFEKLIYGTS